MAAIDRSFIQDNTALILEGAQPVFCRKAEGGRPKTEVIESSQGPGKIIKKSIATVGWNDLKATVALTQAKPILDWMQSTMDLMHTRMNGALVTADVDLNAKYRRDFFDCLLTKVSLPTLSGSSRDAAYIDFECKAELWKVGKTSGKLDRGPSKDTLLLCNNFRVDTGLGDVANKSIFEVSGLGFNQETVTANTGHLRHGENIVTNVKFNNFAIKGPLLSVKPYEDFFEKFVVQGASGDDAELTMQVDFLQQDMKTAGFSIILMNCGITEIQYDTADRTGSAHAGFTARFYCEQMKFGSVKNAAKGLG